MAELDVRAATVAVEAAAQITRQRLALRDQEVARWRDARAAGLSYAALSRLLTVELLRLGATADELEAARLNADNIRKRLAAATKEDQ